MPTDEELLEEYNALGRSSLRLMKIGADSEHDLRMSEIVSELAIRGKRPSVPSYRPGYSTLEDL